jgi:hypothetical protein
VFFDPTRTGFDSKVGVVHRDAVTQEGTLPALPYSWQNAPTSSIINSTEEVATEFESIIENADPISRK